MIFFTHVPKTAGSTINRAARQLVCSALVKRPHELDGLSDRLQYVGGHVGFVDAVRRFPQATFIASLRRPLHRVLSHYMMFLRDPAGEGVSFHDFYAHHITKKKRDNLQCRFLCGEPSAEKAMESIKANYALVWISDRTNDAWPYVREMLMGERVEEIPPRVFVAPNAPDNYDGYLPQADEAFVRADNAQDTMLHEWIATEFNGLFVSYSAARASTAAFPLSPSA